MINVPAGTRILLATRPIDFRKGAHGLAALAQEVLAEDPFSGTVIVYRSKRAGRGSEEAVFGLQMPRRNRRPVMAGFRFEGGSVGRRPTSPGQAWRS
jgi:transposase